MDLCSTLRVGRMCQVGSRIYFVRPLSLEGMAIIMAWLDDVIPGYDDRTMPPEINSESAQKALASRNGQILQVWVGLREYGLRLDEVRELLLSVADETEQQIQIAVVLRAIDVGRRTRIAQSGGGDISETWCTKGFAELVREIGVDGLRNLSFDQAEWLMNDGEVDQDSSPNASGFARAVALYNEAVARDAAELAQVVS